MELLCRNCGKPFESKNNRKVFCKESCRSLDYRKRKGIDEPKFLTKKEPTKEKVELSRLVTKPVTNEAWTIQNTVVENWQNHYDKLLNIKAKLYDEYIKIRDFDLAQNKMIGGAIMGGFAGAALGGGISAIRKDKNNDLIQGLALIAMIVGGAKGYKDGQEQEQKEIQQKANRLNEISKKSSLLDPQINNALYNLNAHKIHLNTISKTIDEQVTETYYEYVPILLKPLEAEKIALKATKVATTQDMPLVLSLNEFQEKKFDTYKLNEKYLSIFGSNLPIPSNILIYGESGHGKSTWSIEFAKYLSTNLGSVFYNSSEEGFGETLQRKFQGEKYDYIKLGQAKTFEQLKKILLADKKCAFLIIDSVNDMDIKVNQLKELRELDTKRTIIYIMQATKGGTYKGSTEYKHDADYVIKIEKFDAIREKGR